MSLRPIDLQTLFMRQIELSREKAALHDGMVQKQAVEQAESVEESLQNEEKVARSAELKQGPEALKDKKEGRPGKQEPRKPREAGADEEPEAEAEAPTEVVRDPGLGRNIDLNA